MREISDWNLKFVKFRHRIAHFDLEMYFRICWCVISPSWEFSIEKFQVDYLFMGNDKFLFFGIVILPGFSPVYNRDLYNSVLLQCTACQKSSRRSHRCHLHEATVFQSCASHRLRNQKLAARWESTPLQELVLSPKQRTTVLSFQQVNETREILISTCKLSKFYINKILSFWLITSLQTKGFTWHESCLQSVTPECMIMFCSPVAYSRAFGSIHASVNIPEGTSHPSQLQKSYLRSRFYPAVSFGSFSCTFLESTFDKNSRKCKVEEWEKSSSCTWK